MLPLKLELKNFLAYCTPDPIYFEGIHLACLSGPNGAGKSSIFDAITWVIWGKARASTDELIHIGRDEMAVSLDFLQGSQRYRIIRQRKLGNQRKDGSRGSGTSLLDLFGWVEEDQLFRVISEASIRQTESKIEQLIGLNYETFVNSAYLQQGKADSFTMQAPTYRKKILGEILNLDLWDVYEERSKEYLRNIGKQVDVIDANLWDIERDTAEESLIRQEYHAAEQQLEFIQEQVKKAEALYYEMAGADSALSVAENELRQTQYQIRERQRDIEATQGQIKRQEERLLGYQQVVDEREAIEAGYASLLEAQEADEVLGDALRELHGLEQHIHQLSQEIGVAQQKIEHEITSHETLIDEAERHASVVDTLAEKIQAVLHEIGLLEQTEQRRALHQEEVTAFQTEKAGLLAENQALRDEMDVIKQRIGMIEESAEQNCPLCGQPLDEAHRERIAQEFQEEGKKRGDRFRANMARSEELKQQLEERQQSIRIAEKTLVDLAPLRGELGSLQHQYTEAINARRRSEELQAHVSMLRDTLDAQDFAHELHLQLREAEAQRDRLAYDKDTHDEVKQKLKSFRTYQDRATQLEIALQSIPEVEQVLSEAENRANHQKESLTALEKQARDIEDRLVDLQAKVVEMQKRQQEWQYQRTVERQSIERRSALYQRLVSIEAMQRRKVELEQRRADFVEKQGVYQQLKSAFSKNGIPAMLIEAAIPELEETTNLLLMKMTDGRLSVRFDTQREKKTGGVAETFDILIADELGTRDYSLYSGGEVFRINFAIRVAISQLLTRRAGAKLRTLFIDEGFGTQDDAGRERLVEAITAIQADFDLILVITHIDDLRDAFPVRIEIEKTTDGSRIRMI